MHPLVEELVSCPDPATATEHLDGLPYRLLLDSAATSTRLGRYSFLTADPHAVVRSKDGLTEYLDQTSGTRRRLDADALTVVREQLAPHRLDGVDGLPPFLGGAAGYVAYDWGLTLERLPSPRFDDLRLDDVVLGIYDWVIAWDHVEKRAWIVSTGLPDTTADGREARARARASVVKERLARPSPSASAGQARPSPSASAGHPRPSPAAQLELRATAAQAPSFPVSSSSWDPRLALRSSFTKDAYLVAVERVREYIFAGDIFQANLSQRFESVFDESPWTLYQRLRRRNAAPFAAFLELPECTILSASPERFLRVDRSGHVETRPIKGTRPRGLGPEHDAALGQALTESAKDRAENLMIVDLLRNDLSRVCTPGTVHVPELFALERYATVHHLVSTVVGELAPGADALTLLKAAFPGGSITGAPKLRAMEIIAELEPSKRGVYCGSIGYMSLSGDLDTSIAIRTALVQNGRIYFNAGGGIVADSEPEQEYRETLDKARGIIDALAPPD